MALILPTVDYFQFPIAHNRFAWGSPYGLKDRLHPNGHRGTDLMASAGTPVSAIADGIVRAVGWSSCLGWYTVVEHKLRDDGKPHVFSGYNHLRVRPGVKVGQKVARGQVIAYVGTTGSCTTGNHLHLTLGRSVNSNSWDATVDPRAFIESHDTPPGPMKAKTPLGRKTITVKSGDTLSKIAAAAGYSGYGALLKLNPGIKNPDAISVGQTIRIK